MSQIPVNLWWTNRHRLNLKMATSLRDKFLRMLSSIPDATALPLVDREEALKRNQALKEELAQKIQEINEIISGLS